MPLSTTSRAVAASAILAASVTTASAAPTILGDYYEDKVTLSCPFSYNCRINFERTPKDKFLTVKQVACYAERSQPLRILMLGESTQVGGTTPRSLPIPFLANTTGNSNYYYNINQIILYKIQPKRFPFISLETSTQSAGLTTCTITGTLSNK